jgi:hypothetical protein
MARASTIIAAQAHDAAGPDEARDDCVERSSFHELLGPEVLERLREAVREHEREIGAQRDPPRLVASCRGTRESPSAIPTPAAARALTGRASKSPWSMTPGTPIVAQSTVAQAIVSQAPRVPRRAAAIAASGIAAIASG